MKVSPILQNYRGTEISFLLLEGKLLIPWQKIIISPHETFEYQEKLGFSKVLSFERYYI